MGHYLFRQIRFVRDSTIRQVTGLPEDQGLRVPQGFNNNVLWNLGHILLVHEKFAFGMIHEKQEIPDEFAALFGRGTKPADWSGALPSLEELIQLLDAQADRIERKLASRLNERLEKPYTSSTGLELSTVEECLSFCLYHEGMHFAVIKAIKQHL